MLAKIRVTSEKASNKSCWELNFVWRSPRAHMSIFPQSGARGLQRSVCLNTARKWLIHHLWPDSLFRTATASTATAFLTIIVRFHHASSRTSIQLIVKPSLSSLFGWRLVIRTTENCSTCAPRQIPAYWGINACRTGQCQDNTCTPRQVPACRGANACTTRRSRCRTKQVSAPRGNFHIVVSVQVSFNTHILSVGPCGQLCKHF